MVIAIYPDEERCYVTETDRQLPESEQTRWYLRVLTQIEKAALRDQRMSANALRDAQIELRTGTKTYQCVKAALVRFENLRVRKADGSIVVVDPEWDEKPEAVLGRPVRVLRERILDMVPDDVFLELYDQAKATLSLTEDDEKN